MAGPPPSRFALLGSTGAGFSWPLLATAALSVALGGCPNQRRSAEPETRAAGASPPPSARPTEVSGDEVGVPSRSLGGAAAGARFALPEGWTARTGGSDDPSLLAVAFSPGGTRIELRRWDGEEASVSALLGGDRWGWSAQGPYASVAASEGPVRVATWEQRVAGEDKVGVGWFLRIGGRPLAFLAQAPAAELERGWDEALSVLSTAEVAQ